MKYPSYVGRCVWGILGAHTDALVVAQETDQKTLETHTTRRGLYKVCLRRQILFAKTIKRFNSNRLILQYLSARRWAVSFLRQTHDGNKLDPRQSMHYAEAADVFYARVSEMWGGKNSSPVD